MAAAAKPPPSSSSMNIPECPVCLANMKPPIFLCLSGHSLCAPCTSQLVPAMCPICRQSMTQMRNRALEEILSKAKVSCPNKAVGCVYSLSAAAVDDHVKECIFRQMTCPLGVVFSKCSWTGQLQQMLDHFRQKHPKAIGNGADSEVELENVNLRECDTRLTLAFLHKLLFIITFKVDSLRRMAYWVVQHIGPKKQAHQFITEIQIISKKDQYRKVTFTEHCFSDTMKVDDITKDVNCAIMPLDMLMHFVKEDKLLFRYVVRRIGEPPKPSVEVVKEDKKPEEARKSREHRSTSRVKNDKAQRGGHGNKNRGGKA